MARTILTVIKHYGSVRAGLNVKYSNRIVDACKELGLVVSHYDRKEEPSEIKEIEGMSIDWGVEQAVKRIGKVPDVIYHKGDWGKEPMITLLGKNAVEVAKMAIKLSNIINIVP